MDKLYRLKLTSKDETTTSYISFGVNTSEAYVFEKAKKLSKAFKRVEVQYSKLAFDTTIGTYQRR